MAVAELQAEALAAPAEESQLLVVWGRFRKHRLAVAGGIVIAFLLLMVILAPHFHLTAIQIRLAHRSIFRLLAMIVKVGIIFWAQMN